MTATNSRYEPVKRKRLNTAQRMAVYEKCQGHCAYCGEPLVAKYWLQYPRWTRVPTPAQTITPARKEESNA